MKSFERVIGRFPAAALPLALLLILLAAQAGICGTGRIALPELAGQYLYLESRAETVTFSPPSPLPDSLWVHWVGTMHDGQGLRDGTWTWWPGFIGIQELDSGPDGLAAGLSTSGSFDHNSPFFVGYLHDLTFLEDGRAAFQVKMTAAMPELPFEPLVYPYCQLDLVEIVYRQAAAAEPSTWGAVKSLYR